MIAYVYAYTASPVDRCIVKQHVAVNLYFHCSYIFYFNQYTMILNLVFRSNTSIVTATPGGQFY